MIRKLEELPEQIREGIRGGKGQALVVDYLVRGDVAGILAASRVALGPGATVGDHVHAETEELYLILEGSGTGRLDGESFPVGPGDVWVCKQGHTHGLINGPAGPLVFFAVLTEAPGVNGEG
jgi:quercetin dioxygenase-like cupin family protein